MLTDFKNFCTVGKRMKFATNPYDITHLTLGMLLIAFLSHLLFCSSTNFDIFRAYFTVRWKTRKLV